MSTFVVAGDSGTRRASTFVLPAASATEPHGRSPAGRSIAVIALVVGTRPEAIKLAPIARALAVSDRVRPVIIATGQHGDVIRDVLQLFDLRTDHAIPTEDGAESLAEMNARLLRQLDGVLGAVAPDLVVVQGDTASTLAGALAAFFRRVPVAHVEAGLRTGDLDAPFPEEGNRRLVSQIATLHLAPTAGAAANLLAAGIASERVVVTGNTVIDAFIAARDAARPYGDATLEAIHASDHPVVVVTAHRRESWGDPVRRIGRAVGRLAWLHPATYFVVAAHMNPAVRGVLERELRDLPNVHLPGPVAYAPFARLLGRATVVLTDSGGIQEEASVLGLPVLVTRELTERTESLEAGVAALVGTDEAAIVRTISRLLTDHHAHADMARIVHPYGDGTAGARVADACSWWLGRGRRPTDYFCPTTSTEKVPA